MPAVLDRNVRKPIADGCYLWKREGDARIGNLPQENACSSVENCARPFRGMTMERLLVGPTRLQRFP
jgi:hypothetical protein